MPNSEPSISDPEEGSVVPGQPSDEVKLEDYQKRIYEGLGAIGPEVAQFYLDGVRLLNSAVFGAKAYLLAHVAREIEGGLREVLLPNLPEPERCAQCGAATRRRTMSTR